MVKLSLMHRLKSHETVTLRVGWSSFPSRATETATPQTETMRTHSPRDTHAQQQPMASRRGESYTSTRSTSPWRPGAGKAIFQQAQHQPMASRCGESYTSTRNSSTWRPDAGIVILVCALLRSSPWLRGACSQLPPDNITSQPGAGGGAATPLIAAVKTLLAVAKPVLAAFSVISFILSSATFNY